MLAHLEASQRVAYLQGSLGKNAHLQTAINLGRRINAIQIHAKPGQHRIHVFAQSTKALQHVDHSQNRVLAHRQEVPVLTGHHGRKYQFT